MSKTTETIDRPKAKTAVVKNRPKWMLEEDARKLKRENAKLKAQITELSAPSPIQLVKKKYEAVDQLKFKLKRDIQKIQKLRAPYAASQSAEGRAENKRYCEKMHAIQKEIDEIPSRYKLLKIEMATARRQAAQI